MLTASKLRENIYRVLDGVLETGEPVFVERKGRRIRIQAEVESPRPLAQRLTHRPEIVVGDSDDFVGMDWSSEWRP